MLFLAIISIIYYISNIDKLINQIQITRIVIISTIWLIILLLNNYIAIGDTINVIDLSLYNNLYHYSPLLLTLILTLSIIGLIILSFSGIQIYSNKLSSHLNLGQIIANKPISESLSDEKLLLEMIDSDKGASINNMIYPYNYSMTINSDIDNFNLGQNFAINNKQSLYASNEYSLIILINLLSFILLLSSYDLLSIIISIELVSFNLYIVTNKFTYFAKDNKSKTRNNDVASSTTSNNNSETLSSSVISSTLLYYLYSSIGSSFIILGSILVYIYIGSMNFDNIFISLTTHYSNISNYHNLSQHNDSILIYISFILLLVGLFLKSGIAPVHMWSPYVYSNNSMPTISWLYIMTKLSVLPLIILILYYINKVDNYSILHDSSLLLDNNQMPPIIEGLQSNIYNTTDYVSGIRYFIGIIAIINLLIGSMSAILENNIVRLFVYSSISHLGFIFLCCVNMNNYNSMISSIFYLIQNSISSLLVIYLLYIISNGVINSDSRKFNDIYHISIIQGLYKRNKYIAICFVFSILSLLGIPPFIGFYAKFNLLYTLSSNNYYLLMLIAILISVITSVYYLYLIELIMIKEPRDLSITNTNSLTINKDQVTATGGKAYSSSINDNRNQFTDNNFYSISKTSYIIMTLLTLVQTLYVLYPDLINNHIEISTLYLYNYGYIDYIMN